MSSETIDVVSTEYKTVQGRTVRVARWTSTITVHPEREVDERLRKYAESVQPPPEILACIFDGKQKPSGNLPPVTHVAGIPVTKMAELPPQSRRSAHPNGNNGKKR